MCSRHQPEEGADSQNWDEASQSYIGGPITCTCEAFEPTGDPHCEVHGEAVIAEMSSVEQGPFGDNCSSADMHYDHLHPTKHCKTCSGTVLWNERLQRWYHEPFEMGMLDHEPNPYSVSLRSR